MGLLSCVSQSPTVKLDDFWLLAASAQLLCWLSQDRSTADSKSV